MNAQTPLPLSVLLVPLHIPSDRKCDWAGKWHLNTGSGYTIAIGGPWNTEQDAVAAVLKTGRWKLRPDVKSPHFESVN